MSSDDDTRQPSTASGNQLWGARFEGGLAPEMIPLNNSLSVDFRLWRQDIQGSRAWARAIAGAGVLDSGEAESIIAGLNRLETRLEAEVEDTAGSGGFAARYSDEDIHSLIERLLFEEAGEVAGKLHTGRSRNDQVATDLRLWGRAAADEVDGALVALCRALHGLAARSAEAIMPGYTHLQQGQPIRVAHWALAHFWAFLRDRDRIAAAAQSASILPLGSGAIAGCPFPVDREAIRKELGFRALSENSVDAVSDRDWVAEFIFAGALVGVHLSRLAEDMVLFSSREFGFLRLSDGYSTGSSLMPQKRNPDVAELARGKSARLIGNVSGILALLKGLPTGYNRDLQEEKQGLFDTVDTLMLTLPPMAGAVGTARFREDRLEAALGAELLATDLADFLVRAGVPFRRSHEAIGEIVRRAEEADVPLTELPDAVFHAVHPAFASGTGSDFRAAFSFRGSADAREVPGGTGREAVRAQLEHGLERLEGR
ncbi:MAG: argininosuccinate lyase [Gemmatimonadota bacterium]